MKQATTITTVVLTLITVFFAQDSKAQYFDYNEIWDLTRATDADPLTKIADINGDGLKDVIVAPTTGSNTRIMSFINNGTNLDSIVVIDDSGYAPYSWTVGDFDNDGDVDIVALAGGGSVNHFHLINDGTGSFTKTAVNGLPGSINNLASGDMDGDSLIDLLYREDNFYNTGTHFVKWSRNLGNNTFAAPDTLAYPISYQDQQPVSYIQPMDIDSDGDLDLIVRGNSANNISNYYLAINEGAFYMDSVIQLFGNVNGKTMAAFDDFDGDGFVDMAAIDKNINTIYTWLNDGSHSFVYEQAISSTSSFYKIRTIATGDVDGDNMLDLILGETPLAGGGGITRILTNNGSGNFSSYGNSFGMSAYHGNTPYSQIQVEEFNQDGQNDLLVTSTGNGQGDGDIITYFQQQDTTFQHQHLNLYQGHNKRLQWFDVNEDGWKDLASFGGSGRLNKLVVSYGDGAGNFIKDTVAHDNIFKNPKDLYYTNWNGNANADYVYANSNAIYVRLDYNTSQDTTILMFVDDPGAPYGGIGVQNNNTHALRVKDIDNDGDEDVFAAVQTGGPGVPRAIWVENTGGLSSTVHPVGTGSFGIYEMEDVNGDALIDLALTRYRSTSEVVLDIYFFDAGTKNFVSVKRDTVPTQSGVEFTIADPDNDSDNDIVIGQTWLENTNGAGTFAKDTILSNELIWNGNMIAADINSDGLVDFIQERNYKVWPVINQGGNQFTKLPFLSNYINQDHMAADIDADGYNDIVTANHDLGTFKPIWYRTCFATSDTIDPITCSTYNSPSGKYSWANSGTYLDTLVNSIGCDSIIIINLTINHPSSGSETIASCDSYTWPADGANYTSSGTYTTILTNAAGCDSTVTLNLTVKNSSAATETVATCDTYTWSANGQTYTLSGSYTATLTNAAGCDSLVTLNLTINKSNNGSETVQTCNSYTWPANGNNYSTSGTYAALLTNAAGCDSTATLNLTISNTATSSQTIAACDTYTWPVDGKTYTTSGIYFDTLASVKGCDSIITLNLTVNKSKTGTQTTTACDSYTWPADGNKYTSNGSYQSILTSAAGCDSVVTLNLNINSSKTESVTAEICDGDQIFLGGGWQTTAGTYTDVYTAANGCDSTVHTTITINPLPNTTLSGLTGTYCDNGQTVIMAGSPAGGTFSGPGVSGNNFDPSSAGVGTHTLSYSYTDAKGCTKSATQTVQVDDCTGLEENALTKQVQIYPNPNEGKFIVTLEPNVSGNKTFFVLRNTLGQQVYATTSRDDKVEIDIADLPAAVYFLEITIADEVVVKKVVKE